MDYDSDTPRKITEVLVRKVPDNQQVGPHPFLLLTPLLPGKVLWWQTLPWPGTLRFGPQRLPMPFFFWLDWVFVGVHRLSLIGERGLLSVVVHGLLILVASLVAEHRL